MSTVASFPERAAPSVVGPECSGHSVIVEGRVIPRLHCRERGDEIELVLDGRFTITVPREQSYSVAWLIATALAIGAGYSHLGAESKDQPFAPRAMSIVRPASGETP
jgi:hypothetical protein